MNAITRPQPHAAAAAAGLRDALTASNAQLRDAVTAYRSAWATLTVSTDLVDAMRAVGELTLAAEAITAAAKHVEATARTALANCMSDTGCPAVALADHTVHLGTKAERVDIEDEQAIPAELMRCAWCAIDWKSRTHLRFHE
jgi:hypothetical protein